MKTTKKISLSLTGLLILGLLLSSVVGALAAPVPFNLYGTLSATVPIDLSSQTWTVNAQAFTVYLAAVAPYAATECKDASDVVISCSTILAGVSLEVTGTKDTAVTPAVWVATKIKVHAPSTPFKHVGELMATSATAWTVDTYIFQVNTATNLPPFAEPTDTVEVTFTVTSTLDTPPTFSYLASEIKVIDSGAGISYTHAGVLTAFTATTWTVDGAEPGTEDAYEFNVEGITTLPPYFGVGDEVKVTFHIVGSKFVATSLEVTKTVVPNKTESSRCENRLKDHPGVLKLAAKVGAEPADILELFCKGFGLGEIKNAYKYAAGSQYSPGMLLALRTQGFGWGYLKKLAAGLPVEEVVAEASEATNGNGNKPDKEKDKHGDDGDDDPTASSNGKSNGKGKGKNK